MTCCECIFGYDNGMLKAIKFGSSIVLKRKVLLIYFLILIDCKSWIVSVGESNVSKYSWKVLSHEWKSNLGPN